MSQIQKTLLFVINPGAGKDDTNWKEKIEAFFSARPFSLQFLELDKPVNSVSLAKEIASIAPDTVVAVGGDGTLKLVVEATRNSGIPIGLIPGGSANGMAKELGIPLDHSEALGVVAAGYSRKIHLTSINNCICIHLSDLGFNAYVIKKFEESEKRGMWGYIKSAWKVLWSHSKMKVEIKMEERYVSHSAAMVVIANATKYGTGVVINPRGRLDDASFEVVIVKRISFGELFKMRFSHKPFHPKKTQIFQTGSLRISTVHPVHFQVDGEYLGKIYSVNAEIIPEAVSIVVPFQPGIDQKL